MKTILNRLNHPFFFGFLGLIGLFLLAQGFARGWTYAYPMGAVDFRNRVVAARQANLGLNPYTFKWTSEYPDTLLDPSEERDAKFSRMTSPPTTLWLQSWFASVDYRTQKNVNFWLNWLCFLFIPVWIGRALLGTYRKDVVLGTLAFLTGVFSCSGIWLFHLERGQQYGYFAMLLVLASFPAKWNATGSRRIATALSVFFRPTFGPIVGTSFRSRKPIRDLVIVAGIGMVLLIPVLAKFPLEYWKSYFACTHDWYLRRWGLHERVMPLVSGFPSAPEGDPTMPLFQNFAVPGNVLYQMAGNLIGGMVPYGLGMGATLVMCFATLFVLWKARGESQAKFALRLIAGLYLVDLVLPAPRSGYNGVIFFPALLLVFFEGNLKARVAATIAILISISSFARVLYSPHGVEAFYLMAAVFALFAQCNEQSPARA